MDSPRWRARCRAARRCAPRRRCSSARGRPTTRSARRAVQPGRARGRPRRRARAAELLQRVRRRGRRRPPRRARGRGDRERRRVRHLPGEPGPSVRAGDAVPVERQRRVLPRPPAGRVPARLGRAAVREEGGANSTCYDFVDAVGNFSVAAPASGAWSRVRRRRDDGERRRRRVAARCCGNGGDWAASIAAGASCEWESRRRARPCRRSRARTTPRQRGPRAEPRADAARADGAARGRAPGTSARPRPRRSRTGGATRRA